MVLLHGDGESRARARAFWTSWARPLAAQVEHHEERVEQHQLEAEDERALAIAAMRREVQAETEAIAQAAAGSQCQETTGVLQQEALGGRRDAQAAEADESGRVDDVGVGEDCGTVDEEGMHRQRGVGGMEEGVGGGMGSGDRKRR